MNPAHFLAMDLIGSPLDGVLQVSDIGALVLGALLLMRIYQRIDKFEEAVARRLGARIAAGKEPQKTELFPQPISVKEHQEFVTTDQCAKQHDEIKNLVGRDAFARKKIYEDLTAQGKEIASLKTEMASQTGSLAGLKAQIEKTNERIDAVPIRVINLLRETKDLI